MNKAFLKLKNASHIQALTMDREFGGMAWLNALDDLVVVVSTKNQVQSLENYAKRWGIETLFSALKTPGFCLEATHLKNADKLSNLLIPLTLACLWAFRIGLWLNEIQPIKLKKHGRQTISYFRLGLEAFTKAKGALKRRLINVFFRPKSPPIPLGFLKTQGLL